MSISLFIFCWFIKIKGFSVFSLNIEEKQYSLVHYFDEKDKIRIGLFFMNYDINK
jgi:hypothetical protein